MDAFIPAIAGGVLIGGAAALLLVALGRVAGISGIFWSALSSIAKLDVAPNMWRITFVLGLMIGPIIVHQFFGLPVPNAPEGSTALAIVSGLLVGFGTKMGSGCTSGHGICGMARFSPRSILATVTFMAAGFVTVFVVRHVFA
ncbi:hypothetical protein A3742_00555 [Oleiphilus sp. HI0071]|uniref:YeeE/YedE family protein n=1 Tax=unclassified Oleiphilus TaxID=2631174 RepID=UPI0007C268DA|nr:MULTISPECIES: YeeE/YedE thiosulfate transporter family protein [unclassified Oleiphilus]KZY64249.1 hypothetical protein A3737_17780 [Oleiphilus sp. HI0065]KZY82953.1 hypothetical protein A3742_00555 [Oleiphilus sp. HI0071]KZZ03733.1 hypothetical protein A3744_10465 [Oleiphilus sp. HI0073]KZZ51789.1 hypothetical protein A3760_11675 [Oleiphilus sp. HI0122]KZZ69427.1 hypothetical protein A3765_17470 [Oleiphilus sp. HI0130]KZZ82307.1 hypothetical protein A3767_04635 [Oleiphilus sp. HI0133]